jgi:hypothetical protein
MAFAPCLSMAVMFPDCERVRESLGLVGDEPWEDLKEWQALPEVLLMLEGQRDVDSLLQHDLFDALLCGP